MFHIFIFFKLWNKKPKGYILIFNFFIPSNLMSIIQALLCFLELTFLYIVVNILLRIYYRPFSVCLIYFWILIFEVHSKLNLEWYISFFYGTYIFSLFVILIEVNVRVTCHRLLCSEVFDSLSVWQVRGTCEHETITNPLSTLPPLPPFYYTAFFFSPLPLPFHPPLATSFSANTPANLATSHVSTWRGKVREIATAPIQFPGRRK